MTGPLRVLQLVSRDEQGGVQALTGMIGPGLAADGIAVTTLALRGHGNSARRLLHLSSVIRQIAFGGYDAILSYHAAASVLGCALGWVAGVPLRGAHQTALPEAVRPVWRGLDRLCGRVGIYTHVVANSAATSQAFSDHPDAYRNRLVLIPHGVEPLPGGSGARDWRDMLGVPLKAPLLVASGRLAVQKNHAIAIAALARLPEAHLAIAGDGPDRAMLLQQALRLGVAGRLHLVGGLDRVGLGDLLAAADLYLFPSVWETFGLAGVEAGMAGLPIVAADLPVLREVLAPGIELGTVRLHPPQDAEALAETVGAMLARPLSSGCRVRSAKAFRQRHGAQEMIGRYLALLGSI